MYIIINLVFGYMAPYAPIESVTNVRVTGTVRGMALRLAPGRV